MISILNVQLAKNGLTRNKKEGDLKTPIGLFSLGNLFYRKDRVKKPNTKLNCKKITSNMGWCNDVCDKKNYNKLINLKKKLNMKNFLEKITNIILYYL